MVKPVDVAQLHLEHYPHDDDDPRTDWWIGPLTSRERAYLADRMAIARAGVVSDTGDEDLPQGTEVDIRSGTVQRERVALGLKGFDNFGTITFDQVDHPVLRGSKVVRDDLLDKIPEGVFEWLDGRIRRLCEFGEDDAGKSSPPSTPPSTSPSPRTADSATSETPADGGSTHPAPSDAPGAATA